MQAAAHCLPEATGAMNDAPLSIESPAGAAVMHAEVGSRDQEVEHGCAWQNGCAADPVSRFR